MSQEKSNLARVRDNQRRSRARRKEYLQELEARLRQCELQGIEASSEIQLAARRVADENKKLRALLAQNSIPDGVIETYVQSLPSSGDGHMLVVADHHNSVSSDAVHELEQLLRTRKACCIDDAASTPRSDQSKSSHQRNGETRRGSTGRGTSDSSTARSSWESQDRRLPHRGSIQQQQQQQQSTHILTPTPMKTNRSQSIGVLHSSSRAAAAASAAIPQYHKLPSTDIVQQINSRHAGPQTPSIYEYDPQYSPNYSPNLMPATNTSTNTNTPSYIQYPPQHHRSSSTSCYNDSIHIQAANVNSCVSAADMIMAMAGGDPSSVRQDLGCLPGGGHCDVDNQLVFDVMDRYSSGGAGI